MRLILYWLFAFIAAVPNLLAQTTAGDTTTIIIVRHAEKATGNNPALTDAGMHRAMQLPKYFPGIKPDEFFTTPFTRTRQTIEPWAKDAGVKVQEYTPSRLLQLVEYLQILQGKTVVIAGHSNTNPQLVNLLIEEDRFENMDDNDYRTIFIVTIVNGKAKVKPIKMEE